MRGKWACVLNVPKVGVWRWVLLMPWAGGMARFIGHHPFIRRRYLLLSTGRGVYDANRRFYSGQLKDFSGILEPIYLAQIRKLIDRMAHPPCAASLEYLTRFFEFTTHSIGSHLGIFLRRLQNLWSELTHPRRNIEHSGVSICRKINGDEKETTARWGQI